MVLYKLSPLDDTSIVLAPVPSSEARHTCCKPQNESAFISPALDWNLFSVWSRRVSKCPPLTDFNERWWRKKNGQNCVVACTGQSVLFATTVEREQHSVTRAKLIIIVLLCGKPVTFIAAPFLTPRRANELRGRTLRRTMSSFASQARPLLDRLVNRVEGRPNYFFFHHF